MPQLDVPPIISSALRQYYTCEMTTVNRQGQPVTWPGLQYYDQEAGQILLTVSIAFPVKALNARRHPQVCLLYSDPTGSGLQPAPAVLIQGDATVGEQLDFSSPQTRGLLRVMAQRQPESRRFLSNRLMRRLFTWYLFQRLPITVEPRRILFWPQGDFSVSPTEIEVKYVEQATRSTSV